MITESNQPSGSHGSDRIRKRENMLMKYRIRIIKRLKSWPLFEIESSTRFKLYDPLDTGILRSGLTSTIFPLPTPHYLQQLFGMSISLEGSASRETIWGFEVYWLPVYRYLTLLNSTQFRARGGPLIISAAQILVLRVVRRVVSSSGSMNWGKPTWEIAWVISWWGTVGPDVLNCK